MNVTRTWLGLAAVGLVTACAACGDDASERDGSGGSGGGDATTSSSSTPSSSGTDATTSSSSNSSSSGGPEECPEQPPTDGLECFPPAEGTCDYEQEAVCPDGSFTSASIEATCADGVWVLFTEASGECCPDAPQQSGAIPCFIEGSECEFVGDVVCGDGGSIGGTVVTTCDGETWQTVYEPTGGVCEGETACPASPPETGDACDSAVFQQDCLWEEASRCLNGPGFNVITVAACSPATQTWSVGVLFEGTECADCDSEFCDPDGMACIFETSCEGGSGTVTTGTVCSVGEAFTVWEARDCE